MSTRGHAASLTLTLALMTGSTVAIAQSDSTDEESTRATFVTGVVSVSEETTVTPPDESVIDGVLQGRGWRLEGATIEMDDPRVSGTITRVVNANVWQDDDFLFVRNDRVRMVNDDGSWSGTSTTFSAAGPGIAGDGRDVDTVIATGEGAYEGLSAYLVIDGGTVEGLVFPGEMPPLPEPIDPTQE